MAEPTQVTLPQSTIFPVEVTSISQSVGDKVEKHTPILRYKYWNSIEQPVDVTESSSTTEAPRVTTEFHSAFEVPIAGEIAQWYVDVGSEIPDSRFAVASIIEPCTHSVQYAGLCALCGAKVDEQDYTEFDNAVRAPISMSHDTAGLKVSLNEAQRIEKSSTDLLLANKKLILVVDLDQTVIHAAVDPTIGEWMKDSSNPNYDYVKDVRSFSLEEEMPVPIGYKGPKPKPTICWYYVKIRPGLNEFLEEMSNLYEMHIYTMATRAYAMAISQIIDPSGKYFGDRILSRDESGNLMQKSLKRLFPVSTSMVAIIDDRGDVWNWSTNLIKVVPYNFFVGIGDINSSFLPQRNGVVSDTPKPEGVSATTPPTDSVNPSEIVQPARDGEDEKVDHESRKFDEEEEKILTPIEQIVAVGNGQDDPELLVAQSTERSASLEAQQLERPLAKLQHDLDEASEPDEDVSVNGGENKDPISPSNGNHSHSHHNLLNDNDRELSHLKKALKNVHSEFYKELKARVGDRILAASSPELPDIKVIMPRMKKQVFKGCVFLFSGIFPLGTNLDSADIVLWVRSFGAVVVADFIDTVTHVIASSGGTKKVRQASSHENTKIVYPSWIFKCIAEWKKVPEDEHIIELSDKDLQPTNEGRPGYDAEDGVAADLDGMDEESFVMSLSDGVLNWKEVDKELEEFMASDDEDDDEEVEEEEEEEEEDSDGGAEEKEDDPADSHNENRDEPAPMSEDSLQSVSDVSRKRDRGERFVESFEKEESKGKKLKVNNTGDPEVEVSDESDDDAFALELEEGLM